MQPNQNRRRFLVQTAAVGTAAALPAGLCGCHHDDGATIGGPNAGSGWVDAGPQSAVSASPQKVSLAKGVAYLTRDAKGSLIALSAVCTHRGCTVAWNSAANAYVCPCHGARFDSAGKNIGGPAQVPLKTLDTKVDASGHVLVEPASA